RCVFFTRPGQVHQLSLAHETTGYMMAFSKDFYAPAGRSATQLFFDADRFKRLVTLLNIIFREFSEKQGSYQEAIRSILDVFFIELQRQGLQSPADGRSEYTQQRLEELQALIEHDGLQHKQVAYYAEKMHLTAYQLNAITKASL